MIPPLVIRADANQQIGFGHVMRCLALAQAWQERGGVTFVTDSNLPTAIRMLFQKQNVAYTLLESSPNSDQQQTIAVAQHLGAEWVVIDSYHFDENYLAALKSAGFHLLCIDDLGQLARYDADLVLNQNIYATAGLYPTCPRTALLLGTTFSLLRREFRTLLPIEAALPDFARNLLITLGGSDANNVTLMVLQALARITQVTFDIVVVVGGGNPHFDSLQSAAVKLPHRVRFERNTDAMASLMYQADMAVTASGSTLWELAFLGVPSVALVTADNQLRNAERMHQLDAVALAQLNVEDLSRQIMALAGSASRRGKMRSLLQAMVDGRGASRTVSAMIEWEHDEPYRLRLAQWEDRYTLWEWANDPVTRQNSFNPQPIPWEDHIAWFMNKIHSQRTRIWILEYLTFPVGQIRYDQTDERTALISFTVSPNWRGKGLGTKMLNSTAQTAMRMLEVDQVEGETYARNTASVRAFEKAMFSVAAQKMQQNEPVYVFRQRRLSMS
jgi:UDP-2,4-diacetamido-2,4,6-trideoxy-beta-L-altropyranose hydrolase